MHVQTLKTTELVIYTISGFVSYYVNMSPSIFSPDLEQQVLFHES